MHETLEPATGETLVVRAAEVTVLLAQLEIEPPFEPRLVMLTKARSEQATGYRVLRHRLRKNSDPHVILVTSALVGEGKTTCAVNLALAMAEEPNGGVLYLDANLARPALSSLFGIHGQRGVFEGTDVRTYPVLALPQSRLRLAAVNDAGEPTQVLDPSSLHIALADLREAYEYVVIDGPSVLEGADANLLADVCDAVVITLRAGRSHRRSLVEALRRLNGAPVLGSVLLDCGAMR